MYQGLIEKNNLGVGGNVNPPAMRYDSGYYTLYRLYLDSRVHLILTCFFVFLLQYWLQYIKDEEGTICVCFTIFFYYFN